MFDPEERRFAEGVRESLSNIQSILEKIAILLTPEEKPPPKKRFSKKDK